MLANDSDNAIRIAKNTSIEREDDEEEREARMARRKANRTMPDAINRVNLEEEDTAEIESPKTEIASTKMANQAVERQMVNEERSPILLGSQHNKFAIKNTFIDIKADDPPAAGHRRHKTCAVDGRHDDDSETEGKVEGKIDDDSEDIDAPPPMESRSARRAYLTEDLRDEFFKDEAPAEAENLPNTRSRVAFDIPSQNNDDAYQNASGAAEGTESDEDAPPTRSRRGAYLTEDLQERYMEAAAQDSYIPPRRLPVNLQNAISPDEAAECNNSEKEQPDAPKADAPNGGISADEQSPTQNPTTSAPTASIPAPPHGMSPELLAHCAAVGMASLCAAAGIQQPPFGFPTNPHTLNPTSPTNSPGNAALPAMPPLGFGLNHPQAFPAPPPPWPYASPLPPPGYGFPFPLAPGAWPMPGMPGVPGQHFAQQNATGMFGGHQTSAHRQSPGTQAKGVSYPKKEQASVAGESGEQPPRATKGKARLWIHIYLHMQAPDFDLVPMLIGRGGCNMKNIASKTQAKVRIRGRGSGHLEIDNKEEAPTPLMVAVTTDKQDGKGFKEAVRMTLEVLQATSRRFKQHCDSRHLPCEAPFYSIGLLPDGAKEILAEVIEGVGMAAAPTKEMQIMQ